MPEGRVVKVLSNDELVVNLGSDDGVQGHHSFLVYALGDEIVDPETHESLGQLEIIRGRGEAWHIQPRMTTIRSTEKKKVLRDREQPPPKALAQVLGSFSRTEIVTEEVEVSAPFQNARVGDLVRIV